MKLFFWSSLSARYHQVAMGMAAAVLCYTVFGLFILPPIIHTVAIKQLSKQLDRTVTIQKVQWNPYTLTVTFHGLKIKDKDGEPWVSWNELQMNFQLVSLFSKAWVFKKVTLSQPFARLQINRDDTLNFSDLVNKFSTNATSKRREMGKSRAWRIERLRLVGAKLSLTDLTPRLPFRRIVGPFELTLTHFKTDPDSKNPYSFAGITDGGERFSWQGYFYLDPFRSSGEFSFDGISLRNYAPLYQDWLRFDIQEGVIQLRATYRHEEIAAQHYLMVTNATLELKSLKLMSKGTEQNVIEMSNLVVGGASGDILAHTAEVASVKVGEGRFVLCHNRDASINALHLLQPADTAPRLPGGLFWLVRSMTNFWAAALHNTNLWTGTIHEFSVTNCALHWEDLANTRPIRLDLDEITVNAKDVSNTGRTNLTAELSLRWDKEGTLRAGIQAVLSPPSAEVRLSLNQINLRPIEGYLAPYLNLQVLSGQLGLKGTVLWSGMNAAGPTMHVQGDVWLDEFSGANGIGKEELLHWKTLRMAGLEADLIPLQISMSEVTLQDAVARLIVETNRTINLITALRRGNPRASSLPPEHPERRQTDKPPSALANKTPPPANPLNTAPLGARITIGSVVLTNATVKFIDRSLQPNVNLTLEQLGGVVLGLTSEDCDRASAHLRGIIDKSALVEITGNINPWNLRQSSGLKVALKHMDLVQGSPYAGKFLGYQISSGLLSADFSYHLAEGKLKSQTFITLDRLTLGAKVASQEATRMPVRLIISVLKDRNGRIELAVPVEGNLDDPTFHLGQAIWHAFENEITQIVTSPFAILSAVFGGNNGEELSYQEFPPGSAKLSPANLQKLDALVKALHARPELQLEITGSADPKMDREALGLGSLRKQVTLLDLKILAAARAQNVQKYLLQTGKVEAERIFITAPPQGDNSNGRRVALRLQ